MQENRNDAILFYGGIRQGEYESLLKRGFHIVVIVDESWPILPKDTSEFILIQHMPLQDLASSSILQIKQIIKKYKIKAVLCLIEPFAYSWAKLLTQINFKGVTPELAEITANKSAMHKVFIEKIGPDSTARYSQVNDEDQLLSFAEEVGYPIILKPSGLYASFFVSCSHNIDELLANFNATNVGIKQHLAKIKSNKNVSVQAEEYLMGSNHSIDCVITSSGEVIPTPIVDVLTGRDIGKKDFHHFSRTTPSMLLENEQHSLMQLAIQGIHALEMKTCIAHVELIYTSRGPRLLEIAARAGGNRTKILYEAYGIDLTYAHYLVAVEQNPEIIILRQDPYAIITPFPNKKGIFQGIDDKMISSKLKSYYKHEVKATVGQLIGTAREGYTSPLCIELKSHSLEEISQDIAKIKNNTDIIYIT